MSDFKFNFSYDDDGDINGDVCNDTLSRTDYDSEVTTSTPIVAHHIQIGSDMCLDDIDLISMPLEQVCFMDGRLKLTKRHLSADLEATLNHNIIVEGKGIHGLENEDDNVVASASAADDDNDDHIPSSNPLNSHSDLIPRVYEGGLKVWECSLDLVEALSDIDNNPIEGVTLTGKRILELGCGTALPGIYAAVFGGARTVHFSDYNSEVIKQVTIPNLLLNLQSIKESDSDAISLLAPYAFFAGDWSSLGDVLDIAASNDKVEPGYDVLLTSETIYEASNHRNLLALLKSQLRFPHGVVLVAAKTYYFGVGGGTRMFEELVRSDDALQCEVCREYTEGVMREILKISYRADAQLPSH